MTLPPSSVASKVMHKLSIEYQLLLHFFYLIVYSITIYSAGTPQWMAPEVIKGTQMTSGWIKADVWSLGCTVVEMLTGTLPYAEFENPMTAMYHIASGKTPPLDKKTVSAAAIDFVETCCNIDPDKRPSVKVLLGHAFIKGIDSNMRIDVKEDEPEKEEITSNALSNGQDLMSSTEMRVILSDSRERDDLHQSPDNSPPPSPPKDIPQDEDEHEEEETALDDELTEYNGLTRTTAKTSLLNSVESLSSSNTSIPAPEIVKSHPPSLINKTTEDEAAALKILELQKTPSMHTTSRANKSSRKTVPKQFRREENDVEKNQKIGQGDVKKKIKTVPVPSLDASNSSSTFVRRQNSKDESKKLTEPTLPSTASISEVAPQKVTVIQTSAVMLENDENKPIKPSITVEQNKGKNNSADSGNIVQNSSVKHGSDSDSRAESSDELSPLNHRLDKTDLPAEMLRYKRERQVSTDSSGMEDESTIHQHPPLNSLKKNKKIGMSKSFSVKSEHRHPSEHNEKPLSLAKHLSKKLNLSVNTKHQVDSDGGSSSGYCASQGSDSGSDYEYIEEGNEDNDLSQGKEEKKVNANATRDDTNTAPSYHDQTHSAGLDTNSVGTHTKSKHSKKKKSSQDSTSNEEGEGLDHSRPVAPFTSEKLFLHNNLGADNFSRAAQGGTAAVRKEAALALNSHSHHHSKHHHSNSKYGGYHATSKASQKHYTTGHTHKKNSKRSKSANVGVTGSAKLVLPSLLTSTNIRNGTAGGPLVVIPQLALRVIQSAPNVTRSVNLPPLMKSKTPSNKNSKSNSRVFTYHSDQTGGGRGDMLAAGVGASSSGGGDSFQQSLRFVPDEAEQEGGILAPRGKN